MKKIVQKPGIFIITFLMMNLFFVNLTFSQTQTYNTPGTYTFTVPAGVTSITVSAWGGGGAGGGVLQAFPRAGGGGEGGSFVRGTLSPVTPGTTYTIVVGNGGTGSTGNGTAGQATSVTFGSTLFNAIGGAGGIAGTSGSNFGTGGNTTNTGNIVSGTTTSNNYGGNGGNASNASTATSGGGGGSAGASGGGGNGGTPTAGTAGSGGGVAGAAGRGSMQDGTGNIGGSPGAGGSGARCANNGNGPYIGGDGGDGQVQITWTCATPSLTNLNTTFSSTPTCANAQATVQLSSTSVPSGGGPYNVYYDLSGANTATAKSATVTFNGANPRIATFNIAAADLVNGGSTTVTITSVGCAAPASGQDNTQSLTTTATLSAVNITPTGAQAICASGTGSQLTVAETGGGTITSRQWGKRSVSGGAITPIGGATGTTYTPTGASLLTGTWFVVCTSTPTCGTATVSNEVTVTVTANLSAVNITPTGTQTFCESGSGSLLTAAETGGTTFTRQWGKRSVSGGTITALSGQTGSTYTPTGASLLAGTWFVVCTSTPAAGCGSATVSNEVIVVVNATPQVTAFNGNTICSGDIGTLTATLTGSSPFTVTYNPGAVSESGVVSGTPFNVTPNPSSPGTTNYTITLIEDANGCQRSSGFTDASASITVTADLSAAGVTPTGTQTICASGTGSVLTAAATGGGTVTRQWGKRSVSGGTITPLGGQTGATYTPTGASLGTGAWFVVCTTTPTCGSPIISNEITVTVNANLSAVNITPTGTQTFCVSGSGSLLTAAETGGTTFTRQWGRRSVSGGTITNISGQTGATYTPTGASLGAGNWFVVCTSTPATGCGSAIVSNEVAVVVNALPQVSGFSGNAICSGGIGQLTVTTNAGTAPFIVTYNPGGVSESGITSGTPFNPTPNPSSTSNYTITLIEDANGCQRNSGFTDASATITVSDPLISISYSTNPAIYCPGIAITTNTPTVTGGVATLYSVSPALPAGLTLNTSTGVISGTPTASVAAADYTVTASNTCGNVSVDVNIATDIPVLTTTPGERCGTGVVALAAASGTSCFTSTINWFSALTGGSSLGSGGSFNTPSIGTNTNYYAEQNLTGGETTIGTSSSTTTNRGLEFDLYEQIVLKSVQVQNNSGTGSITIALRNSSGGTVAGVSDVSQSVGTGVQTVTLNWTIPAGTDYRILYSSGTRDLRRTSSNIFPKSLGVGVITASYEGGSTTARYNYFYNWSIARTRIAVLATVNPVPTIALGANPSVDRGNTSANLSYSGTTGTPDEYSITWNGAALSAGFTNVVNAALPATPIVLTVPAAADATTYNGTLTVRNTTTGCVGGSNAFSVTINKTDLNVTADDKNKTFDGNVFTGFTSTITGFVNGENSGVVTGTVTYTGAATTATAIGTYTITPVVTGLSATNYNFIPVNGTLEIEAISQSNADFRSKANGNFSSAATWEYDLGGGNWQNASVPPTSSNNVSITHDVVLDQDYTVGVSKSFALGTGATFVVNPTRTFAAAINAAIDFGGKAVTLQSDNTGTAAIGQMLGTVTGATNVTVERYIRNNGFRSWRLLSVPTFGSGQTIRQAWQEGDANPLPMQNNLANRGTQITGVFTSQAAAAAAGFDSTSVQAGMLTWNGTNWSNVTTTNSPIANNQAYFLYIRGERSKGVTGSANNSSATTLRTNGTIYTGDQLNNIGANSFALVPNVYPSAIDFTGLTRTGGVSNLFYVWDSKKQNGNSLGIYQTFSGTNGFNCMISGGSYTLGQPNTIVESGQAFFVQSAAAGTVTLKETSKTSSASGQLGFRPMTPASALVKIDTRLYGPGANNMIDANVVVFDAAYSNAVDGDDAIKFTNPGENLGIQKGNTVLAIEGRQPAGDNDVIQYKMWNMQQQAYSFEFVAANMATQPVYAVLEDAYLNTSTTLDLSGTTTVNFTVNADAASKAANRFRIVFRQLAPVPVNFVSVTGHRINAGVKVDWKSASERGIKTYVVERSTDGRNFTAIGNTAPASNNAIEISYSFNDVAAPSTALMYRIKSQGVNNEIRYSPVARVNALNVKAGFVISPNPVEDNIVNLQFNAQQVGKYNVRIISTEGKTIMVKSVTHAGGNSTQTFTLPTTTARGTYTVEIIAPDNTKTVQTLFVNKK